MSWLVDAENDGGELAFGFALVVPMKLEICDDGGDRR